MSEIDQETTAVTSQVEELEAKAEAAKSARLAILDARAERDRIEALKLEISESEVLNKLEAEHGELGKKLVRIKTPTGSVFLKKPNPALYRKFSSGKMGDEEVIKFVHECLIHPTAHDFKQLVSEYPALYLVSANEIAKISGNGLAGETIPKLES